MRSLPNDVLLLVGEQIDQQMDRWNLLFVSHHFHDLFLPLLYRTVPLKNWNDAKSFLLAVRKRRQLARVVQKLDLIGWRSKRISNDEKVELQCSAALHEWLDIVSYSNKEKRDWARDLAKGLGDAWIALLLPLLNQLRQLHLVYGTDTPYLNRIMQQAISGERPFDTYPPFRCLREVTLNRRDDFDLPDHRNPTGEEPRSSASLLLPFFQLPSVRTITADSVIDPSLDIGPESQPRTGRSPMGLSSITEIDLRASNANYGMEVLVASCADLKSFKYQHSDSHVCSHGYQPSALYRSLAPSKASLQTLWLDHHGSHYPFTALGLNQTHDEWFGSLVDFTVLREVRIRLPNLLDIRYSNEPTTPLIDCLPSSLEAIYIEGCEERHVPMLVRQLQAVIKNRRTRAPRLQQIDIEGGFQNAPSEDSGHTDVLPSTALEGTVKEKILQAAEPLHLGCIDAGIDLHVHDRALAQGPPL
ncbi:hypothetical protein NUU61_007531 [Penicillium alfredii]|uniref:Leucine-rich repeat domain-containing protein n=1 Tax=Penicillium alfredii TaxID=1506179 RepID=A0A9W9F316_9EURO|nr:uncharacterized protein NUU61_007531 [Penicillium alfredii]KAJ5092661.1 hypothetical protein NUU61_007531 [Penicillium alfredii]